MHVVKLFRRRNCASSAALAALVSCLLIKGCASEGAVAEGPAAGTAPAEPSPILAYSLAGTLAPAGVGPAAQAAPTFVPGPWPDRQALALAAQQAALLPPPGVIDLAAGFTIGLWVWVDPEGGGSNRLLAWGQTLTMDTIGDQYLRVQAQLTTTDGRFAVNSRYALPTGQWLHVVFAYSPSFDPTGHLHAGDLRPTIPLPTGLMTLTVIGMEDEPFGRTWIAEHATGAVTPKDADIRLGGGNRALAVHGFELRGGSTPIAITVRRGLAELAAAGRPVEAVLATSTAGSHGRPAALVLVPTFNCVGAYVLHDGVPAPEQARRLRYRLAGERSWREAPPPVLDVVAGETRGSILRLPPDTEIEVEASVSLADRPRRLAGTLVGRTRTWSDNVPIGEVRDLPPLTDQPLEIRERGRPDAWILCRPAPGSTARIDAGDRADAAVLFHRAAYVVLENVEIRGGRIDAVNVLESEFIRIRHCDIAAWGHRGTRTEGLSKGLYVGADGKPINNQAGVRLNHRSRAIVVEGNLIHAPNATANSWAYGHPLGPMGILTHMHGGNIVVRYNDIVGSEDAWWNDAIQGAGNSSVYGGPYRGMDIAGNLLAFANDDSTELDGGQINVRFWGNRIEHCFVGMSGAPCVRGPAYIFGNVFGRLGDAREIGGTVFKMGTGLFPFFGVTFLWHNTLGEAAGRALNGTHTAGQFVRSPRWEQLRGTVPLFSANNIYGGTGFGYPTRPGIANAAILRHDLVLATAIDPSAVRLEHPIAPPPRFRAPREGDYRLAPDGPGREAGVILPGVNEGFRGRAPDLGALEGDAAENFPVRPWPLTIQPQRLEAAGAMGAAVRGVVMLSAPPACGEHWQAIGNAPWLTCEPAGGPTGDVPIQVTVTIQPSEARVHRGAITFRTDRGFIRTLLVQARIHDPNAFVLYLEAEDAARHGPMLRKEMPDARGGACTQAAELEMTDDGEPPEAFLEFNFTVPTSGDYYLRARVLAPGPTPALNDSFLVALNDEAPWRWDFSPTPPPDLWVWQAIPRDRRNAIGRIRLAAGNQRLRVYRREPLAHLDTIVVTDQAGIEPPPPPEESAP